MCKGHILHKLDSADAHVQPALLYCMSGAASTEGRVATDAGV
jgi:hypothetical protein